MPYHSRPYVKTVAGQIQNSVTTEQLQQWYYTDKKTTRQIADLLSISQPWARKLMKQRGICMLRPGEWAARPKGFKMSEDQKAKISKANKGKKFGRSPNNKTATVACSQCGKNVARKLCQRTKYRSFCGQTCKGLYYGRIRAEEKKLRERDANGRSFRGYFPCDYCGSEILRTRNQKRHFCNQACAGRWKSENLIADKVYNFRGGYEPYYGPNWRAQRHRARVRDGYTCQRCGITREQKGRMPDVHHIIRFREFGIDRYKEANALSNLICYCNVCHKIVEEQA